MAIRNHECPECHADHRDMRVKFKKGGTRKKGSALELDIAKQIAEHCGLQYGHDIGRTPNSGAIKTRADIWVIPKFWDRFRYFVEMKNRENWRLEGMDSPDWAPYKWYGTACDVVQYDPEYPKDAPVLMIFKRNLVAPLVMFHTRLVFSSSIPGDGLTDPSAPDIAGYSPAFVIRCPINSTYIVPWDDFLRLYVRKHENVNAT